ncbi:MAG: hypothetical protein AAF813_00315 [Pseudomonadota bacterium]
MFFEMLEFLGWGWLIFFHLVAFTLLFLPILWGITVQVFDAMRERINPTDPGTSS